VWTNHCRQTAKCRWHCRLLQSPSALMERHSCRGSLLLPFNGLYSWLAACCGPAGVIHWLIQWHLIKHVSTTTLLGWLFMKCRLRVRLPGRRAARPAKTVRATCPKWQAASAASHTGILGRMNILERPHKWKHVSFGIQAAVQLQNHLLYQHPLPAVQQHAAQVYRQYTSCTSESALA
jgi:hypothetical protein